MEIKNIYTNIFYLKILKKMKTKKKLQKNRKIFFETHKKLEKKLHNDRFNASCEGFEAAQREKI